MKAEDKNQFPFELIQGIRQYDFNASWTFLQKMGKSRYGKSFRLYKEDREVIYKLLIYAIRDEENCEKHQIDPNKGILLTGPVGCGKTSLMTLIKFFLPPEHGHVMKPAREVAFEFNVHGHQIIQRHATPKTIFCYDDLGVEQIMKHYGNDCNVMAEILLSRYDLFISHKTKTHATTNLNAGELEKMYGNRVRSRMRELFNLIAFDSKAVDKRK